MNKFGQYFKTQLLVLVNKFNFYKKYGQYFNKQVLKCFNSEQIRSIFQNSTFDVGEQLNYWNKRTNMIIIFKKTSFNNDEKSEILLKMNKLYRN